MAVHTKHPVSAPPTPPSREKTGHLLLRAWCGFVLFGGFAGAAWQHAFGTVGSVLVVVGSGVVTGVLWALLRPAVQWRRLPWFVVAFLLWACLSAAWSQWIDVTALTLLLLVVTTVHGMFIAAVLTWRETVAAIADALKWVLGLSILFELWVSIFIRVPVLPGFVPRTEKVDPIEYWSRNNLFDGGRLQGIVGNANLLAPLALAGIVVFAIRFAAGTPRRSLLVGWGVLAAFLFVRAASATGYVAAAFVALVLVTVLLMRRTRRPERRTPLYLGYAATGVALVAAAWAFREPVLSALGRGSDLTGREQIWTQVLERAAERPGVGWGYATPWLPWNPAFDGWVIDHGQTVMQAHNVWFDTAMQLGVVGVVILALLYLAYLWRSWFFAVDRPRWDLRADRPYSALSLLPTLVGALLVVQGLTESAPLMLWGWMLTVLFAFKIKQTPLVGVGPAEFSAALERGEPAAEVA